MQTELTPPQLYKLLAHPTRLAILGILRDGEQCVCHMEAHLGLRQAHISQHLMLLREAGLVSDRRDGWNIFYQVTQPEIFAVIDSMNTLCGDGGQEKTQKIKLHARRKSCPCPKCTPGTEKVKCDPD